MTPDDVRAQQHAEREARIARRKDRVIEADKRLVMARQNLDDSRFAIVAIANALYAMVLLLRNQGYDD